MNNCTRSPWHEADFEVNMSKTPQPRSTFRRSDAPRVHAVVAPSTFRSRNGKSTACSEHFWKLRWSKSGRRCGAQHIWKSKC